MDFPSLTILSAIEKLKVQGKFQSLSRGASLEQVIGTAPIREIPYDMEQLEALLTAKSPFIYLNRQERELIKSTSKVIEISGIEKEVFTKKNNTYYHMMILLEGELFAIDPKNNYCEALKEGDSFGADACLFGRTDYSIITSTLVTKIMMIPTKTFFELLNPEKQFTLILGRNLLYKQKIFAPLEKFTSYTGEAVNRGEVDVLKMVKLYKKINSSLHPFRKSHNLDISAWNYAVQRLPENLTSTFIYHLTNTMPELYLNDVRISEILCHSRKRTVYKTITGKDIVILRDMESDLNDFFSNLCIHYIESKKLRRKLKLPTALSIINETESLDSLPLTQEEIFGIQEIWKNKSLENIRNLILHHEDYRVVITTSSANLKSGPSEKWTEALWQGCEKAIGYQLTVAKAMKSGLVVDVLQGSSNTLLNLISPYYQANGQKIQDWFATSRITLKTKEFYQESDRIFAMGHYYLENNPQEQQVKKRMEEEAGIITINNTEMTGVKVMIVNLNRLDLPNVRPKSQMHLIVNIGYTFGKQGYDIIKCFNMLFDNCIDSFSFIGKAGGLKGKRKDILVSTKFHDVNTKAMTLVNPTGINQQYFESLGIAVHKGPMLTVAGTILQNKKLLEYYSHIEGCVGLEMEGCYFAQAIQQGIEMGLLKETVPTRFLYYVSDIPLDPSTNLAQEGGNVNWGEGVPTMSAIAEQCLLLCADPVCEKVADRLGEFIDTHSKVAVVQNEWKIAEVLLKMGYAVACFVNSREKLPVLYGEYITVDYCEEHEYFRKLEAVIRSRQDTEPNNFVVVFNDPMEDEFWVPVKAEHTNKVRYKTVKVVKNYLHFKRTYSNCFVVTRNDNLVSEGLFSVLRTCDNGYLQVCDHGSYFKTIEELFQHLL